MMRYLYIILLFTCLKSFSQDISFISLSPNVYMNPAYAGFQSCYDCDYHFELHHRQQWTVTSPKALHASLFTADRNFNLTGSGISRPTNMSLGFFWLNSLEGESNYETNNFALMSAFSSSLGSNSLQFSMAFQIGHTRIDFDDNLIFSNQIDPVLGPVIPSNNTLPLLPYRNTDLSIGFNVNSFSCSGKPSIRVPDWLEDIIRFKYYNFDFGVALHHFQSLSTYSFYQDNTNNPTKLTLNFLSLLKKGSPTSILQNASFVLRKELQALQAYDATSVKNTILTNFNLNAYNGKRSKDALNFLITTGVSFQDFLGFNDIGDTYSGVLGIGLPSAFFQTYLLTEFPISSGYGGLTFEIKLKFNLDCAGQRVKKKGSSDCPVWYSN